MTPDYNPYATIAMWALLLLSLGMFCFYVPTIRCTSIIPARSELEDKTDPEFDWDDCRDTNFSLREWVRPYITLQNVLIVFHPLCVWFLAACVARSMQVGYWAPLLLAAVITVICAVSFSKIKRLASFYMGGIAALEVLFVPFIWFRRQEFLTQFVFVCGAVVVVCLAVRYATKR
jgi:membrane protein